MSRLATISKSHVGAVSLSCPQEMDHAQVATLRMAATDFGFLVRRGEALDGAQFAERILATYGQENPRVRAVVSALSGGVAGPDAERPEDPCEPGPRG